MSCWKYPDNQEFFFKGKEHCGRKDDEDMYVFFLTRCQNQWFYMVLVDGNIKIKKLWKD